MAKTNLNIEIDESLEKQVDDICNELGITIEAAVNILLRAMANNQGLPINFSIEDFNAETLKAICETKNNENLKGPFNSIDELMEDLNASCKI